MKELDHLQIIPPQNTGTDIEVKAIADLRAIRMARTCGWNCEE